MAKTVIQTQALPSNTARGDPMTDKPDSPEAREQSGEGYDGRYGCLAVAVVCLLLAIIPVASAVIGKGFPRAIGLLELGALLVIAAVVLAVIATVGFIIGKPKK